MAQESHRSLIFGWNLLSQAFADRSCTFHPRYGILPLIYDEQPIKFAQTRRAAPAMTWRQFKASTGEAFGFLCMVNAELDRPQLPTADDLARLMENPVIAAFLDGVWRRPL